MAFTDHLRSFPDVDLVEPLGDLMDVHGTTPAGSAIVARIPAHEGLPVGQAVPLVADTDRLLLFADDEGGANLALPGGSAG